MPSGDSRHVTLPVPNHGTVSGLLVVPQQPRALLVLAHGAGAGMGHPFMEGTANALAAVAIGTLRFQFPYTEAGKRRPDPAGVLQSTELVPHVPLFAGGKSMGGRMTSLLAASEPLPNVRGLVFLGFPLHQAGNPSADRGHHLSQVALPMLFLQGTRDKLAELTLLEPLVHALGARATLHILEGADHSFAVPKKSGRLAADVWEDMAATVSRWMSQRSLG